jgi:hypothetical protein
MTNLRAVAHLGFGGDGWTEALPQHQPDFACPRSLPRIQSCAVQKAICALIWTALTFSRPFGTDRDMPQRLICFSGCYPKSIDTQACDFWLGFASTNQSRRARPELVEGDG